MVMILDYINSDMLIRIKETRYMDYYVTPIKKIGGVEASLDVIHFKTFGVYCVAIVLNGNTRYFVVSNENDINKELSKLAIRMEVIQ